MPHHAAHYRIRLKRTAKKQPSKLIKRLVLAVAIIEPAMTLPQIYQIWVHHEAEGVSSTTWGLYISAAVVWLLYGIQLRDKPLIISSALWIVTEAAVVVGTLLYS